MGGIGDFIGDTLFGSEPEQVGTAQSPGQSWLQGQLQPLLRGILGNLGQGQGAYNVPQAPQAPGVPDYNVTPYSTPQSPFSSIGEFGKGYETIMGNLLEPYGSSLGSARGGWSGAGQQALSGAMSQLTPTIMNQYASHRLPYDQMQGQQGRDVWNMQNQVWGMPMQQQNLGYTMGQIPQWQQQTQAMNPLPYAGMYSGTYGSPIVQPGQEGLVQSMLPFAAAAGMGTIGQSGSFLSNFGSNFGSMFGS